MQAAWLQTAGMIDQRVVQLNTNTTAEKAEVLTRWFPRVFISKVKLALVVNGVKGASGGDFLDFKVAEQTAPASVELPGSWSTTLETAGWRQIDQGNNYEQNSDELILATTNDMWVRIGVVYKLSAGSTPTTATFSALVSGRS